MPKDGYIDKCAVKIGSNFLLWYDRIFNVLYAHNTVGN